MASGVSATGVQVWLPSLVGLGVPPSQYYVGLVSSEPRGSMNGTQVMSIEPSGGAYARRAYGVGPTRWTANPGWVASNTEVVFPNPTADWGYLTHYILCSAIVGGDLFAWGLLDNPTNVVQNVAPRLAAGAMILSMPVST